MTDQQVHGGRAQSTCVNPGEKAGDSHGLGEWGHSAQSVVRVLTLYGGDAEAMLDEWALIKRGGKSFDLFDFNCGHAVMRILTRGFDSLCSLPVDVPRRV
jgi:hypothetical protein